MFDIGVAELLVILIVAVVVIGPKDLPLAMRVAGRWIGKMRRMSAHFRSGIDAMVREAELEDMEKKWKAQNEEIMRRSAALTEAEAGAPMMTGPPPVDATPVDGPPVNGPPVEAPVAGGHPVDAPPVDAPPVDVPAIGSHPAYSPVLAAPPAARPAIITIGGNAADFDPPPSTEPILPAKPHLADDDV